jgi:hypothetical protein
LDSPKHIAIVRLYDEDAIAVSNSVGLIVRIIKERKLLAAFKKTTPAYCHS